MATTEKEPLANAFRTPTPTTPMSSPPPLPAALVNDPTAIRQIADLKAFALGNARILYGSESRKFFDIVIGASATGQYGAVLVCSFDGASKILRKEVGACALEATRALVNGLQQDTGLLFGKYDVGDQVSGQQGYYESGGGFCLDENKKAVRDEGPVDDTMTLQRQYRDREIPRGPKGPREEYGGSYKRTRLEY